eukprot:CAMPEP_0113844544 /NCGR_PEP_ID=MMETSP0372-20130328/291_1 /TAXON_ID=340204 /ORGANISM="Lankesteria abbotti" /LENGTH=391 /DNA_ID=CAMNT_0000813549 /DNA_START=75 /DNA_END=1250 /DNA_ORIENTATION=+ /assembly_acc=CAM_ASM_000359
MNVFFLLCLLGVVCAREFSGETVPTGGGKTNNGKQVDNEPKVEADEMTLPTGILCSHDVILKLLHIVDISYSQFLLIENVRSKFLMNIDALKDNFFKVEPGLVSFSDKPTDPTGYANYDYCYREDQVFGHLPGFVDALNGLEGKSGLDWPESQLDAVKHGLRSSNLGWQYDQVGVPAGKEFLRVFILATDAAPNMNGRYPSRPDDGGETCEDEDYPTMATIVTEISNTGVKPIVFVTDEVYSRWVDLTTDWPNVSVIKQSASAFELQDAIQDELENICTCGGYKAVLPRRGKATSTCSSICADVSEGCDNPAQTVINTNQSACNKAAEEAAGRFFIPFTFSASNVFVAEGCNHSFLFGGLKPIADGPDDCNAIAAPHSFHTKERVCCCSKP